MSFSWRFSGSYGYLALSSALLLVADMGTAIVIALAVLFIAFIVILTRGGMSEEDRLTQTLASGLEGELTIDEYGAPEGADTERLASSSH